MSTPARYLDPEVYRALSSQYVCGTLRGKARRRFVGLMQRHTEIAESVAAWERQMDSLNDVLPEVTPSPSVWQSLDERLEVPATKRRRNNSGLVNALNNWWVSVAGITASMVFAVLFAVQSFEAPVRVNYVAVLENSGGEAQWVATSSKVTRKLRIEHVGGPLSQPDNLFVWAISKVDGSYYRLGRIKVDERQWIALNDEAWGKIKSAESLIVTFESSLRPIKPSEQVVAKGLCVQLTYDEKKQV